MKYQWAKKIIVVIIGVICFCVNEQDYVRDMTVGEIREYMKALLSAMAHVHQCKIIHRDIKHSNFLYNRRLKQ